MNKNIFSIPQAGKFCAMSRGSVWKYVKSGELKASLTPGGHYRILKKDLESFMREKKMYPLGNYQPSGKKVLIVDDSLKIQKLLTKVLSSQQYETDVASDGFEAGIKVMQFKPGLIILDLFMPGIDGFEVCRRIKNNSGTFQIKILAITGYDSEENRDRIMAAGADGYMAKPLDIEALLRIVEGLLTTKGNLLKVER